jgi:hypothetical protein
MSEPNDRRRVVSDEERAKAMLEQLKGVHAVDIGRDMVIAAVNFSYPKLGLSDETRGVRDLNDVRVSIELVRAILEVLEREHAGEKTSDLHDTLAQMQLAYAHAVQLANAERAAAGEADRPAPDEPAADASDAAGGEAAPAAGAAEAPEPQDEPPAAKKPAARKKPAAGGAAGAKKPPAKKPVAKKKPPAKKPVAKKKPAGDS